MDTLEISGKTVEEATRKALSQLKVDADEVEIAILSEGKSGILGLGSEEARISVKLKNQDAPEGDAIKMAKDILEQLLNKMSVRATVNVDFHTNFMGEEDAVSPAIFNIAGDDLGILIGRRGQTLDALQYLLRLLVSKKTKLKEPLIVDVENYKQRRFEDLRALALNVATQVKIKKTSFRLEPMTAFERRIIHLTLANDPDVTTESTGEGEARKVVVIPKKK